MTIALQHLRTVLTKGTPAARLRALADLRSAVREKQELPFDQILSLLRKRGGIGRGAETAEDVRDAMYDATREVALARGRQRGLRGPTPDMVGLADRDLMWNAIEVVWDAVSIFDGAKVLDRGLALATERQRHFYAIWWTISEVCNGGFHQYFENTTGIVAPIALQGLRALGARKTASALANACKPFDGGRIANRSYRARVIGTLDRDVFDDYDNALYATYEQVFRLAAAYIRKHPSEFFESEPPRRSPPRRARGSTQ